MKRNPEKMMFYVLWYILVRYVPYKWYDVNIYVHFTLMMLHWSLGAWGGVGCDFMLLQRSHAISHENSAHTVWDNDPSLGQKRACLHKAQTWHMAIPGTPYRWPPESRASKLWHLAVGLMSLKVAAACICSFWDDGIDGPWWTPSLSVHWLSP